MKLPHHLLVVIDHLKKLPGVGTKSAERFAFEMLSWSDAELNAFASVVKEIPAKLTLCQECGCLIEPGKCTYCLQTPSSKPLMCIVAAPRDVFAIESTREFKGHYHVLGALLSPLDGIGTDSLPMGKLKHRISLLGIKEVVIALDSTIEGDATSLYIKQELTPLGVEVSRLEFGLPMGSSIDYVDGGTLARALSARSTF
jgi:recombination protein RecR